jgi:Molecular chaperone, HSP90 family
MELQEVRTPKEFFRSERDAFYSDWTIAFWREFFQNSVDAGAKNIAISISTEKARGSFNLDADGDEDVTRIVFDDDGRGMSAETLRDVYFAIGKSTKGAEEGSVGGFGRARLMTCFSQKRYSILTGDSFVMGDGPQYVMYDLKRAKAEIDRALDKLFAEATISTIEGLNRDSEMLMEATRSGGRKGCRVEVDLDHVRTKSWHKIPTEEVMAKRLKEYLSESQIPANVTINGQSPEEYYKTEGKLQARRGSAKRTLVAQTEDGPVEFATVHRTEGAKAAHKGKMIVRVDGASMYTESISDPAVQVILEINTSMSRAVLNSNRDGIRDPYRDVVSALLQELATDNLSALIEKKSKTSYRISGDKGLLLSAKAVDLNKILEHEIREDELESFAKIDIQATSKRYQNLDAIKAVGVTPDAVETFMNTLRWGSGFASGLQWNWEIPEQVREAFRKFREDAQEHYSDGVEFFLEKAPDGLREWAIETIASRLAAERAAIRQQEADSRLRDQNDVYMHIIKTNEKTKAALSRHHPKKWDMESGRGRILKAQLAAWTAACGYAIDTLRDIRPGLSDFNWMTGFVLSLPEQTYEGDSSRLRMAAAMHIKDEQTEAHVYLMNPFNEDGSLAFKLSSSKDRNRMISSALHEVAHTVAAPHNEAYALTLTDLIEHFDFDEAKKRMREQERAVAAAYEKGRARVQAMDDEPGPRPAERLLALASGNRPDWNAVEYRDDGTFVVDCDRVADNALDMNYSQDDEDRRFRIA